MLVVAGVHGHGHAWEHQRDQAGVLDVEHQDGAARRHRQVRGQLRGEEHVWDRAPERVHDSARQPRDGHHGDHVCADEAEDVHIHEHLPEQGPALDRALGPVPE